MGFLEIFNDLEYTVSAHDRVIHYEAKAWRVFEHDGAADQPLDAFAMLRQENEPALLLVRVAEDADEDDGGVEVTGHIDVVDGDQASLANRQLAADYLADFPFEEFANALESKRRHALLHVVGSRFGGSGHLREEAHSFCAIFSIV